MNETPRSERFHIGLFGKRNSGKSSLINALTGQEVAVVSPYFGHYHRSGLQSNGVARHRSLRIY